MLNPQKKLRLQASVYIERFADDTRLSQLSKKVRRVLDSLYYLPLEYKSLYTGEKSSFLSSYKGLLHSLQVHLSIDWLNRKIATRDTILHRIRHFFRGLNVKFPEFPQNPENNNDWYGSSNNKMRIDISQTQIGY